jgi:hypothetical protein
VTRRTQRVHRTEWGLYALYALGGYCFAGFITALVFAALAAFGVVW